jgi:peptidoglycan/xylan/chitin deacetylase (PgdA/CDA1 family)
MGRAIKAIRDGEDIPSKTVVLTIDDGYRSFYQYGLPLLEEYGYPATLYINTANVGHKDYFNWDEIRNASERGIEIGNHSHAHGHFLDYENPDIRKAQFFTDINMAQTIFFDSLGYSPDLFSYPYGEYDDVMQEVLTMAGFSSAAAQYSGILYTGTNLFEIPRFPMGGPFATLKGFIQKSRMNPIVVLEKSPEQIAMKENPPMLELVLDANCINAEHLQCFVNGERNCITEMQEGPDFVKVKVSSRDHLPGRRSLYTITAPAKNGKGWCWYSHVWVNTAISEE